MKSVRWVLLVVGLVVILAVAAVGIGLAVSRSVSLAQGLWPRWGQGPNSDYAYGTMGPGMMGYATQEGPGSGSWRGPGMMGYGWDDMPFDEDMPCAGGYVPGGDGPVSSLEDATAAVRTYVDRLGYSGLEVSEVMEFERNYYAIVAEQDTGIGAMEVLVDKDSGAVGPEPGPNMMWNAEYGMHGQAGSGWGGMMGSAWGAASGDMSVTPQQAEDIAQEWLDANFPGRTAGEADAFYGYYTLHFLQDGQVEGMLSVNGSSGDVWYHSWHGDFVQMSEGHE